MNVLSQDPHVLIYMDAGAPDGWNNAAETARLLKQADIADAAGSTSTRRTTSGPPLTSTTASRSRI